MGVFEIVINIVTLCCLVSQITIQNCVDRKWVGKLKTVEVQISFLKNSILTGKSYFSSEFV